MNTTNKKWRTILRSKVWLDPTTQLRKSKTETNEQKKKQVLTTFDLTSNNYELTKVRLSQFKNKRI